MPLAQFLNISWWIPAFAAAVLIGVTALLLGAVLRKRAADAAADQALPGDLRAQRWAVAAGIAVPALLILIMALSIPTVSAAQEGSASSAATIEVIGHQWWWEVRYPAGGFVTANEIHIPVGKPVTLNLTSADVIHSFWIPQLHPKLDAVPGLTTHLTLLAGQPGTYQGECSEYCGLQHAHMGFIVVAQSQAEYDQWVAQQKKPAPGPKAGSIEEKGEQAFLGSSCVYCHTVLGTNASGRLGPDLTHLASRATLGAGVLPNTPGNLAGWVVNAQAIKPGNKMPPMDLDADQLQAILAYLESLK